MSSELSDQERSILAFEDRIFRTAGAKEQALRKDLGLTMVQYHVQLVRLARDPRAIAHAPATIRRVRQRLYPESHATPPANIADARETRLNRERVIDE